jgi:sec-independent protein translocase protein TatB
LFEVGFSELLVIAVVALLVLGPERLPRAARMAGSFMRKARNSFEGLKAEVERELEAEDLKKRLAEFEREHADISANISASIRKPIAESVAAIESETKAWLEPPRSDIDRPDAPTLADNSEATNNANAPTDDPNSVRS